MNTLENSSNADSVKKLHHDLGAVLGNLRAFEFLLFAQPRASTSTEYAGYKDTYRELMKSLDLIVGRLAALEKMPTHPRSNVSGSEAAR